MNEVSSERRGHVLELTLARPDKKNAITLPMFARLAELFEEAARDREVRVLVLRGAGGNFSSGADLSGAEAGGGADGALAPRTLSIVREDVGRAVLALHRLAKPTVAMVEGIAAGAGANFALACDLVYAAEDARLCQIFVRRALSLDCGGSWTLPRRVGLQKAKELAFFGEWVSAPEAKEIGLVTGCFPPDALEEAVRERADALAARAPLALALIKQSLDASYQLSFAEAVDQEATGQAVCTASEDFLEGVRAFIERREPRFTGG
jgi:2-(1,2-epoxy-1,2-dihydrophenyl)acetyl-CoA isomerase